MHDAALDPRSARRRSRRGARRLPPRARLPVLRRPRDRAAPAEPCVLPDLGRGARGAAARPRAPSAGRATTGSSRTTATAPSRWRSASRPLEMLHAGRRRGRRPRVRRAADAVSLGLGAAEHREPDVGDREPVPARGRLRGGGARTSAGARTCPGCTAHGDELTYVSLGEGATSEGEFWESLNTATRLHLPVLFVVADNGYAISVRSTDQHPAPISEMVRGIRGLHVVKMDGRDYFEVRRKGANAIAHVRAGAGPCLVHALVTRPYSHSLSDDQKKYRVPEELDDEREHDPITVLEQQLLDAGALTAGRRGADARRGQGDRCAPRPRPRSRVPGRGRTPVLGRRARPRARRPVHRAIAGDQPRCRADGDRAVTFGEAIRLTLHEQMALDERIRVFGEDVADADPHVIDEVPGKGGVFGITFGLQRAFGDARCFNTPLAEANIIGRAVGQAMRGLRPCAEIQFFDYVWPAMNQLRSEAATTRWRSNGAFTCPMVVRIPIGGYLQGGAMFHSQSGESIFAHVPGLLIAFPSRARDAAGLLRTALPLRGPGALPRAQAPVPAGLQPRPDAARRLDAAVRQGRVRDARRPGDGRDVGRDGAPRPGRGEGARAPTPGSRSSTCARSRRGTATSSPSRCARPGACSCCTRTRSRAASAPRSPRSSPTSASSTSTRRCGASPRPTPSARTSRRSRTRSSPRPPTSNATSAPPRLLTRRRVHWSTDYSAASVERAWRRRGRGRGRGAAGGSSRSWYAASTSADDRRCRPSARRA